MKPFFKNVFDLVLEISITGKPQQGGLKVVVSV
jgi:hypothetical protein